MTIKKKKKPKCKCCQEPNKWLAGDLCVSCYDRATENRFLDIMYRDPPKNKKG